MFNHPPSHKRSTYTRKKYIITHSNNAELICATVMIIFNDNSGGGSEYSFVNY